MSRRADLPEHAEAGAPEWQVEEHDAVDSTQTLARGRRPWCVVVAHEQRLGRGQRERSFVSDRGGLYLSAVLPYAGDPLRSRGFALAVGWAAREALLALGVAGLRLRWPNDLMIGARKVGGILVEQGGPDTLVVGIGLNVTNRPWLAAPELREVACSLEEAVAPKLPKREALMGALLSAVRRAFVEFEKAGFAGMVARLNASWGEPRTVALEAVGSATPICGQFAGVAPTGDIELIAADGASISVPEHHIARLREI
jgi:BirA family transcriptional regulator, biotin operon repressor / biotin---[acetyl-CoA-carboxylase] ligase